MATKSKTAQPSTKDAREALGLSPDSMTGDGADEAAPWERPVEGDPSISEGKHVEPAPEPAPTVEGTVFDPQAAMQSLMDWCAARVASQDADQNDVMAQAVARILAGESAEEVLSQNEPISGKNHPGKPFLLHSFRITEGEYDEGWPYFASMDATADGGRIKLVINCGGPKVIAVLKVLDDQGEYPYYVQIKASRTRSGFTVLDLVDGRLELNPAR